MLLQGTGDSISPKMYVPHDPLSGLRRQGILELSPKMREQMLGCKFESISRVMINVFCAPASGLNEREYLHKS